MTEERKKELSEAQKKRWADPEWRAWVIQQSQNARLYGKKKKVKKTKEEKFESYSKASKKRWADPKMRQKMGESVRKALENVTPGPKEITPEMREHYRQAARKRVQNKQEKYKICPLMIYYYRVECRLKWSDVAEKLNVPTSAAWDKAVEFRIPDTPIYGEQISVQHEIISRGAKNRRKK